MRRLVARRPALWSQSRSWLPSTAADFHSINAPSPHPSFLHVISSRIIYDARIGEKSRTHSHITPGHCTLAILFHHTSWPGLADPLFRPRRLLLYDRPFLFLTTLTLTMRRSYEHARASGSCVSLLPRPRVHTMPSARCDYAGPGPLVRSADCRVERIPYPSCPLVSLLSILSSSILISVTTRYAFLSPPILSRSCCLSVVVAFPLPRHTYLPTYLTSTLRVRPPTLAFTYLVVVGLTVNPSSILPATATSPAYSIDSLDRRWRINDSSSTTFYECSKSLASPALLIHAYTYTYTACAQCVERRVSRFAVYATYIAGW